MTTPPSAATTGLAPVESFHFALTVEQCNLHDVVKTVLHSICFHRVFGTVRPKTIDLFGMTWPAVHEGEIDTMVQDQTETFCRKIESKSGRRADLFLFLLNPTSTGQRHSTVPSSTTVATDGDARTAASPVSTASKSLKSWASSRTMSGYPYIWLAHAFSGGAGQVGGSHAVHDDSDTQQRATEGSTVTQQEQEMADMERRRLEKLSFETWRIRFDVVSARSERERERQQSRTASYMADFLDSLLIFVDEKKAHIPAIVSADLCPFSIEIHGFVVP